MPFLLLLSSRNPGDPLSSPQFNILLDGKKNKLSILTYENNTRMSEHYPLKYIKNMFVPILRFPQTIGHPRCTVISNLILWSSNTNTNTNRKMQSIGFSLKRTI